MQVKDVKMVDATPKNEKQIARKSEMKGVYSTGSTILWFLLL